MRLTSTGLGIGTASPTQKLEVAGTGKFNSMEIGANNSDINNANLNAIVFKIQGTERLRLDTSGNLGLGVTPSAWWTGAKAFQMGAGMAMEARISDATVFSIGANQYIGTSTNRIYLTTNLATLYEQNTGQHRWYTAPSGTAGNAISFTQAMTLDASGNLGIGTASPASKLDVRGVVRGGDGTIQTVISYTASEGVTGTISNHAYVLYANNAERARIDTSGRFGIGTDANALTNALTVYRTGSTQAALAAGNSNTGLNGTLFGVDTAGNAIINQTQVLPLIFSTSNTERARITSGGDLLVGLTTGSYHILRKAVTNDGGNTTVEFQSTGGSTSQIWYGVSGFNANAANAATKVGRDATTLRSINAGGTVNASGADYAEYMTKAGDFALAKGDVCGINADGKLTNVFANAISFVVKSTDPSYVGGDSWGAEFKDDPEGLEAARQKVDRIAFAGQVPVNVLGATPGQYIVPINDNGAIKGVAVSNPTFEQYQSAVGKVIAVQDDGRALIIVKVA
jgi:hypothetical protein